MSRLPDAYWRIKDPWRARLRDAWCRWVWCRLVGHDPITKFDGTVLCRRHV